MARPSLEERLQSNGCGLPIGEFVDQLVEVLTQNYRTWSVDELVLHPDEAKNFCNVARRESGFQDLPDDLILRCLMNRRKNP